MIEMGKKQILFCDIMINWKILYIPVPLHLQKISSENTILSQTQINVHYVTLFFFMFCKRKAGDNLMLSKKFNKIIILRFLVIPNIQPFCFPIHDGKLKSILNQLREKQHQGKSNGC